MCLFVSALMCSCSCKHGSNHCWVHSCIAKPNTSPVQITSLLWLKSGCINTYGHRKLSGKLLNKKTAGLGKGCTIFTTFKQAPLIRSIHVCSSLHSNPCKKRKELSSHMKEWILKCVQNKRYKIKGKCYTHKKKKKITPQICPNSSFH